MSYNHDTTSHSEKQVNLVQIAQEVVHNLLQYYSEVQPLDADAEGMFHYVYITYHKDTYEFYVGKHSSKNPATDSYIGSGLFLQRAIEKHGIEAFEHHILCYLPSSQEAYNLEASIVSEKYIKLYRDELRITYNLVSGGVGINVHSEESRQKMSEQIKKYYQTPEARLEHSERMKRWHEENPEAALQASERTKKFFAENPEAGREHSQRMKKFFAENPEAGREHSDRVKKRYEDNPEARLEASERTKKWYEDNPQAKLAFGERMKKFFAENPEAGREHGEYMREYYEDHPEARLAASERTKKYFAENPEARRKKSEQMSNKPVKLLSNTGTEVEVPKNEVLNYLKQGYFFLATQLRLYNPSTMEEVTVCMFKKGKCYKATMTPRVIKLLEEGWLLGRKPKI